MKVLSYDHYLIQEEHKSTLWSANEYDNIIIQKTCENE